KLGAPPADPTGRFGAPPSDAATSALPQAAPSSPVALPETLGTTPAGGVTVDLQGHLQSPMRATIGADGKTHVECAAPALAGTEGARAAGLVTASALSAALVTARAQAAIIVVDNFDAPGGGFNDATPAAPVGGNTGTTLGQQRLNAVQYAADIWG